MRAITPGREMKDIVTPSPASPPTPVDPFKTWRRRRPTSPQRVDAVKAARVIREVLATVTDAEWEAVTQGVLRRIARGGGEVSDETRQFARDMLAERQAAIPSDAEDITDDLEL